MRHLLSDQPATNHIRAVFPTSAAFFDLSARATYQELAEQVSLLRERHSGRLVSIAVKTDLTIQRGTGSGSRRGATR